MKHHPLAIIVCLSAFCSLAALPALAAPSGTISSNIIASKLVPSPYGAPPQKIVEATLNYKVSNDYTFTIVARLEDILFAGTYSPTNVVAFTKIESVEVPAKKTTPVRTMTNDLGFYNPTWVYTSQATLQYLNTSPATLLDSDVVSQTVP